MTEPPSKAAVWRRFLLWVLGVPVVVAAALAVIWAALWLTGGDMVWQAVANMGTTLFWLAAIALMYPAMLWVWWGELRDGLRAADDWASLSEAERRAALAKTKRPVARGRA